jgi:hypothetical protein
MTFSFHYIRFQVNWLTKLWTVYFIPFQNIYLVLNFIILFWVSVIISNKRNVFIPKHIYSLFYAWTDSSNTRPVSTRLSLFGFYELLVSGHVIVLRNSCTLELYFECSWYEIPTGRRMLRIFLSVYSRGKIPVPFGWDTEGGGGMRNQSERRTEVKIKVFTTVGCWIQVVTCWISLHCLVKTVLYSYLQYRVVHDLALPRN